MARVYHSNAKQRRGRAESPSRRVKDRCLSILRRDTPRNYLPGEARRSHGNPRACPGSLTLLGQGRPVWCVSLPLGVRSVARRRAAREASVVLSSSACPSLTLIMMRRIARARCNALPRIAVHRDSNAFRSLLRVVKPRVVTIIIHTRHRDDNASIVYSRGYHLGRACGRSKRRHSPN